ncbi:MAG: tRNA adenosine(34) deaminase TadA [Victivallales bacterium]|nr:tRNA adenosine(34) deaminase TadA [Victivallales bacterium]
MDVFSSDNQHHEAMMRLAIEEALAAAEAGEVPVGAVIACGGEVVARAHNCVESTLQGTAHAELLAIQEASRRLGMWRLDGCTLYVTKEPCAMCAGAMVNCRVPELFFGCPDPKTGAAGGFLDVTAMPDGFHTVRTTGGLLASECLAILQDFFRKRRQQVKQQP